MARLAARYVTDEVQHAGHMPRWGRRCHTEVLDVAVRKQVNFGAGPLGCWCTPE